MTEKATEIIRKSDGLGHSWLRSEEREQLNTEYNNEKQNVEQSRVFGTGNGANSIQSMRRIKARLDRETPPEMDGATKDVIQKTINSLETKIKHTMPSTETMRRNPAGAIHENTEHHRLTKKDQLLWKNLKKVMHPDSEDPDLCNLERLRSSVIQRGGTSTFMADAQISGHVALSEKTKENVPEFMDKIAEGSALGQIKTAEFKEELNTVPTTTRVTKTGKTRSVPAYQPKECACGCGNMFVPIHAKGKYATKSCRSRDYYNKKKSKEVVS